MKRLSLYALFSLGILMACSETQDSSIFKAVKNRDLKEVQKLVEQDKSVVGEIDAQGETPLHIATKIGDAPIVHFFIQQNINLDIQDQQGNTPLILATTAGYYTIVKLLIDAKADLTIVNNRAFNAPKVAFDMNKPEILRLFLAQGITKKDYYPKLIPTKLAQKTTTTPFKTAENRILSAIQNNDINLFTESLEDKDTKVNYNAQDEDGKTLLHIIAGMTSSSFLRVYLENDRSTIDMRDKDGVNALMFAIMAKNVDSIRQLILAGANLRTTDNQFKNILDYAVLTEDTPTFNMVINNFKSLNDRDMLGNTPLHYAAQLEENTEILTLLLESGANVNIENKLARDTPLHIAAKAGNAKAIETLIKFGSNLSTQNAEGKSPQDYIKSVIIPQNNLPEKIPEEETTVQSLPDGENLIEVQEEDLTNNNSQIIEKITVMNNQDIEDAISIIRFTQDEEIQELKQFLQNHSKAINIQDNFGRTALSYACEVPSLEAVKALLEYPVDFSLLDYIGFSALHYASMGEHTEIVEYLIQAGCDINLKDEEKGLTALLIFISKGNLPIVKILLNQGADVNIQDLGGWGVFHYAAYGGFADIVKPLLDYGANINQLDGQGLSPLMLAIQESHPNSAISLIENGADTSKLDAEQSNLLHIACYSNNVFILEILLPYISAVNQHNIHGLTPLHISCAQGNLEITRILLHSGADINAQTMQMLTPLHFACSSGNTQLIDALLEYKPNLNIKSGGEDISILHYAVLNTDSITVEKLIHKGADINAQNTEGNTPLMFTIANGQDHITKTLIDLGADMNLENKKGQNPLSLAVIGKNIPMSRLLLQKGADMHTITQGGFTTKEWMMMQGNTEMKDLLEEFDV